MLNQVLKVSAATCQQFVADAVKISNILDFRISQGSVATYCRCGENLCCVYIYSSYESIGETILTRGQSNLTKSESGGTHSPVRGHPRGSKFVPLNSWGRGSY